MDCPSAKRVGKLNDSIRLPTVSQHLPIEKYYELLEEMLVKFLDAYQKQLWDEAYAYGKRYARIAMEVMPNHGEYYIEKYAKNKKDAFMMAGTIMDYLALVVEKMDEEELIWQTEQIRLEGRETLNPIHERSAAASAVPSVVVNKPKSSTASSTLESEICCVICLDTSTNLTAICKNVKCQGRVCLLCIQDLKICYAKNPKCIGCFAVNGEIGLFKANLKKG